MTNRLWTKDYICICLTTFFIFLNYYYLLVTIPIYLIQHLEGTPAYAGLLVTVFYIAAIVVRPFAGQWITSLGIKKVFFISLIIYLGASLMYFFTTSMVSLLILRVIHGIGFGMISTTTGTIVATIIPPSRKGEGMGYNGLMMNISMAMGPFLGLIAINQWGVQMMFAVSVASVVLGAIAGLLIKLPKEEKQVAQEKVSKKRGLDPKELIEMSAIRISLVGLFFAIVYASIVSFVSVYAKEIQLTEVASYFFIVYAAILILSRPFTGRWFDQYGENVIMYPSIICFAIGMFILSQADSAFVFLLSAAFIGIGWGTIFPSAQTIAIQLAPPERKGVATGTFFSTMDSGLGLGSLIVGVLGTVIGYSSLYFCGSIFVLLGLVVYYFLHGKASRSNRILANEETLKTIEVK
ncbi:MFS transporter [Bacillus sp. V3B]|uniref:MFS transporter n=1 Tax=Bacillus sp. V3B TaxID=2804915 RepID=UPI00210C2AC8|nr:MFS transporter [Bacillus sp. V3B]MCQ6277384.1 MFS transporter [Bacillus sp. V3B]